MFGYHERRIAEMSRSGYARDLAEYARLEYPTEDPRTVSLQAREAASSPRPGRGRSRFLEWFRRPRGAPVGNV